VLESLRNLLKEVSAILSALRRVHSNTVDSAAIERIQELIVIWSANLRPGLNNVGVPQEVLGAADKPITKLARLTSGGFTRNNLIQALNAVWKVLHEQVLLELAKIPDLVQLARAPRTSAPAALFPEIPDLPNQFVPNSVQGWSGQIKNFLRGNPFGSNVFIMVSYRRQVEPLVKAVKKKLTALHLNPILAKDHAITNDLYNPVACLLCCSYGVAIFDRAQTAQTHNPNVVYELGMMHLLKRPCVILKHHSLAKMPTDLLSMLYEDYSTKAEAVEKLNDWWQRTSA
jgi:hypothetical protein